MHLFSDHLVYKDVSGKKEMTTSKIREISVLLKDSLSVQLKTLEVSQFKRDIEVMKKLQKDINKEQLSFYSVLPMESMLKSK